MLHFTVREIVNRMLAGVMIYLLFKNIGILLNKPVQLDYYVFAIIVVLFDWDVNALCGSAIISTLLRMYFKV